MKLGDVLRKEREARGLTAADVSTRLGMTEPEYEQLERGLSQAEQWGPILARIAIRFETPTSRLICASGRSSDAKPGECGSRIRARREQRGQTAEAVA